MKKIILILLLLLPVIYALFSTTLSCFSDVEVSKDNTFTAGTWGTQADFLAVDAGGAKLTDNGQHLYGIVLSGSKKVTIDRIMVSWTGDTGEKIKEIKIGENVIWNPDAALDTDYPIEGEKNIEFEFDSNMQGKSINIKFIMGDASVKNVLIDL